MEIEENGRKLHVTMVNGSFACTCKNFRVNGKCDHIKKYRHMVIKGSRRSFSKDKEKDNDPYNLKTIKDRINEKLKDINKDK